MDYKKLIIKEIIISLVFIIVFSAVMAILGSDINSRTVDFVKTKQQLYNYSTAIGSLAYLQSDAETAKKYLPQISSYLMTKDQLVGFPKDINAIAQQNNLSFSVTFGSETPLTAVNPRSTGIAISSQSQATLSNFINFLTLLENSRYFIKFNSIDINQSEAQLRTSLTGNVFSF